MLRVGLTGGLGSGKSTVALMLAAHGAQILSADEIGRSLMQPGQDVFAAIVARFGAGVVRQDGTLDRAALARVAFSEGRIEELNAIVHPATIALQSQLAAEIFARDPGAVVVVESALIFETKYGSGWRERFDCIVLVTASEELKIARFCARCGATDSKKAEADAKHRLAQMISDSEKLHLVDFAISNNGSLDELQHQVDGLWSALLERSKRSHRL